MPPEGQYELFVYVDASTVPRASADLHRWLQQDPDYRGRTRLVSGAADEGTLGLGQELLQASLSAGSVAGLFTLIQTWMKLKKSDITVRIKSGKNEIEVSVDGMKADQIAARLLQSARDEDRVE
jgi:hypothetical protein